MQHIEMLSAGLGLLGAFLLATKSRYAGLAFVANRYGEAAAGYREICQAEAKGAWAEHACAMADIAAQLERLLSEGERYGAAAHYGH